MLDTSTTRDKVFSIRLTQWELEKLKELAREKGQSTGGYVRFIIFGNAKKQNDE